MTFAANLSGHFENVSQEQGDETVKAALEALATTLRDAGASGMIHFAGKQLKFFPGDNLAWD